MARIRNGANSAVLTAARRMVEQIEGLVAEIAELREDNRQMRSELQDALALMEQANNALAGGADRRGARGVASEGRRRRLRRGRGPKGRATPPEVTTDVVRAVLAKLGEATAAQIAAEITTAGAAVSGRAVRFIAERAGAHTFVSEDGQRRYRL